MTSLFSNKPIEIAKTILFSIVTGVLVVTISISMTALIFHGRLLPFFGYGVGISLCAIVVLNLVLLVGPSYQGIVSGPQSATSIILATGLALLYDSYPNANSQQSMHLLMLSYIFLTTTITGLFLLLAGKFKLGRMVRFVPYPVFGGVLAGTGYLIITAAISFMVGTSKTLGSISFLGSSQVIIKWIPGALFAIILFLLSKTKNKLFLLPLLLFLPALYFYKEFWISGLSFETAYRSGIVMQQGISVIFNPATIFMSFNDINFSILLQQKWTIISIVFISCIAMLFNLSSLELVFKDDINLDKELQLSGFGNILSGIFGGIVGYQMLAPSALNHILGARSKISNLVVIALSLLILLWGGKFLRVLPVPLIGGYLLFIGLSLLHEFLYGSLKKLHIYDFLVVLSIFAFTVFKGLLPGIGFGIVAAFIFFIVNYAKVNNIKCIITGENYFSNVERSPIEENLLRREGRRICAFRLNGYLFFGSAHNLVLNVKRCIFEMEKKGEGFIIVDFKDVQGIDSSAIHSFFKIKKIVEDGNRFTLIFTQMESKILNHFLKDSVITNTNNYYVFKDLDRGFEWCEDQILERSNLEMDKLNYFSSVLKEMFHTEDYIKKFKSYLVRRHYNPNEILFKKGEKSERLYFIERGQFTILMDEQIEDSIRYRKIGSGAIVGEMGLFTGMKRSASVITVKESSVYELSSTNQQKMETEAPEIAYKLQTYILQLLSKRLSKTTHEKNLLLIDRKNQQLKSADLLSIQNSPFHCGIRNRR